MALNLKIHGQPVGSAHGLVSTVLRLSVRGGQTRS